MPTGSPQSRRALRIGAAASVSRYRRSVGQAGSSPYPGRSIAIAERLPRAAGYDAHMWRLESEPSVSLEASRNSQRPLVECILDEFDKSELPFTRTPIL